MADIVIMPKLGFDMAEGTLVRWVIGEGKEVTKGAVLAEIETDKATVEVESTFSGMVVRHLVPQGEIVPVNTPIAVIAAPGEKVDYQALGLAAEIASPPAGVVSQPTSEIPEAPAQVDNKVSEIAEDGRLPGNVKASPLARRVAEEKNIDLLLVKGTGPGGRITRKDVESHTPEAVNAITPKPTAATTPLPVLSGEALPDQVLPVSRLRAAISRRMVEAKQQIPHFYVTHEYDMEALMSLRQQVNSLLAEDQKTSVNDYLVKAVALALREFPNLNASLSGEQILRHAAVHIGIGKQLSGIGGFAASTVKDAYIFRRFAAIFFADKTTYILMHLLGLLRCCCSAGPYGPNRLVCHNQMLRIGQAHICQPAHKLAGYNIEGDSALALFQSFTQAENRNQFVPHRCLNLPIHGLVSFAKVLPSLRVPYDDVTAS